MLIKSLNKSIQFDVQVIKLSLLNVSIYSNLRVGCVNLKATTVGLAPMTLRDIKTGGMCSTVTSQVTVLYLLWHNKWMCCPKTSTQWIQELKKCFSLDKSSDDWWNVGRISSSITTQCCCAKNPNHHQKYDGKTKHKQGPAEPPTQMSAEWNIGFVYKLQNDSGVLERFLKDGWKEVRRQMLQREVKSVTVAVLPRGTLGLLVGSHPINGRAH